MACRITDDIIDSLQHCRLKAFLKLNGEVGSRCGYESLLIEQRANAQRKAIEKIQREYSETDVATHLDLSVANLRRGAALSRPMEVVVLNCWVTATNEIDRASNASTSLAKSARDRVRRSIL